MFLQGILWALITPPWQAPDEAAHFAYIQHLSEHGTWLPPGRETYISTELQTSISVLKTTRIHKNTNFSFTPTEAESALRHMNGMTLEDRVKRGNRKNRAGHYPPLYYKIGTLGYLAFYNSSITARLFGTRMMSLLITSLTVLVMFWASRQFFEGDTLCSRTASVLLVFQPMFAFIGSCVILDTMLILISTIMILLCLLMIKGKPTWKLQAGITICMALGLLSKPTFAAMIPLWFLALLISFLRNGLEKRKKLVHAIFTILVLGVAGFTYLTYGGTHLRLWLSSLQAEHSDGAHSFLNYLGITFINLIQPWTLMAKRFLTSYWANFGMCDTTFPFTAYEPLILLTGMASIGVVILIWKNPSRWFSGRSGLVSYGLWGSIIFSVGIVIMSYTIAHQSWESGNLQGRYFFPTISLHMMILTAGLLLPIKSEQIRKRIAFLLVGAMLLFHIASFALVFERYYL